jgi:hypothetical protein
MSGLVQEIAQWESRMKVRYLALALVLIALLGGLALGHGRSSPGHAIPNLALRSFAGASPLLRAARPHPIAALPQGVPPTGPSPVNFLTAGVYQNNPHPNNSGIADVAFGDFNGDGNKDMVTVDGSACVSVLPGDGKGHFSGTPIDSCIFPVRSINYVVAGDFNNDGILDVAVVSESCCQPNNMYVMWAQGNGDGTFTYVSASTVSYSWNNGQGQLGYGEQARSLIAADLNGDGNLDLVMTTNGGGPNNDATYVFLGNGKFGFTPSLSSLFGGCSASNGAVVADFNHDGIPDLAVTNTACGVQEVEIMIGNGDGTFQPVASNGRYPMSAGGANYIAAGDFNGDKNVDLVVIGGAGGNPITAFLGNGDGTFGNAIYSPSVYNPNYLAVGDFNGDGKDDVIVSSDYEGGGDFDGVQLSNGDGTFASPVQYSVLAGPTRVFVADLNGDGHPDWVSLSNGSEFFCVGLGSGTGGFLAAVDSFTTPGGAGATTAIAAADFNKDGNLDYATVGAERNYPGLNVSLGDGSGNFGVPVHYAAGSNPSALTVGDFNHDGYPDIAVLDQSDGMVTVLLNKGDGTGALASPVSYQVGAGGGYIQTADFNHDGNLDLVVTNTSDGTVSVLLGNSNGTFQPQIVSTSQPSGSYLAIADFNGDGIPDVAITSYSGPNISILVGNGDGSFQAPTSFAKGLPTPAQPIACGLAAADFNKDGKVDLAVCAQLIDNGSSGDGGVAIFLGNGNGTFQAPVTYPTVPAGLAGNPVTFGIPRVADLNNDGNLDIVVPNYEAYVSGVNLGPAILLGKGDGTFTLNPAHAAITGPYEADIALGDFNNDGFLDIAVQNFNPGNSFDTISSTVTMLLSSSGTEVVLTSSLNPSTQGQPVTFTASVVTSLIGLPTPTGTVTFELGATEVPVTLVNGVATYTTSTLPIGNAIVFAAYSGDTNFIPSTSLAVLQVVKPAPLAITTTTLPDAVQNVTYSSSVMADGGIPSYSFTVTSGSPPAGLTLSSNGTISGTPTGLPGTSSFTVQVQDSENPVVTATASLSITVASNLKITTTGLPNGVVNDSYNAGVAASGGIPSYTFSITGGTSLPAGLVLNSGTGVISGTPLGPAGTSNFTVQVQDSATPAQTASANLSITVSGGLTITTTSLPNGVQNVSYNASVAAAGGVGPYSFSITSGAPPSGITMNSSGAFSGSSSAVGTASFTVQAKDSSTPAQTATASLSITIAGNLAITTTSLPNGVVSDSYSQTLAASGGIPGYTFSITSGTLPAGLTLNGSTGVISGTPSSAGTSSFTIQVKDSNTPADTATANLSITVTGPLAITTTSLPNGVQNASYSASVAAAGGVGPYSFSITSGAPPSGITMNSSGAFSGSSSAVGTASFTVQAKDSSTPAQTVTANLAITIAGNLAITTTSLPNGVVSDSYSQTLAASGGIPSYTFSITSGTLPAGLTLNGSTGVISGTPSSTGTASFTVQVKDSNSPADTTTASLSITVTGSLAITTTSLPNGVQNASYSASVAATGGVGPYSFSITSGAPPSGITMNSSGAFSGSSSVVGTSSFTVQAKDSSTPAQTATASLSITITNTLTITTGSLPNGVVNDSYNASVAASGGVPPYSYQVTSGNPPSGITMNSSGAFSGAPTGAGTSSFTVQVKDSSSPANTATANLSIMVTGALQITTTSLINGVQGSAYSANVTAAGGVPAYTFTITSGSLPAGLTLNSGIGVISGTPSAVGTSSFTVQAKDSSTPPQTATTNLSITITNSLTIITTSLPGGVAGSSYSATIAAAGGNPPYTFSDVGGFLPGGLSLSSSGALSGTPSVSGIANFTVQVKDSSTPAQTATASFSFTISGTLTIGTLALPGGVVGDSYNSTVAAAGGTAPYTFSRISGTLPAGLSLSSGGVISGTPSGAGTSTFTVQVTDSSNPAQKATAKLSITVVGPLEITTTSLPPINFGSGIFGSFPVFYSTVVKAQGGVQPYTWSCIDGCNLPPGLTLPGPFLTPLGSGTTTIGGEVQPGAPGIYTFDVQVSDSAGNTTTSQLSITVTQALAIATTSLPAGSVGVPYNATITAANGTPPYTFSIISSLIPPGLSMNAGGVISGTPTTASTYGFPPISVLAVQVQDSSNPAKKATAYLSITISQPVPLSITTFGLPGGSVGNSYNASVTATGGTAPYTFTTISGSLPTGLSLTKGGLISGKPSTVGTSSFTVQVKDSSSPAQIVTASFSIAISPKPIPLAITTRSLPNGSVANSYSGSITTTGGNPPYIFTTISGSLPAGLTLDSFFGQIAGTPSVTGTSSFTVQVQDSSTPVQTASATLSITISPKPIPLVITTTKLPNVVAGSPYNASVVVSGGNAPYTFLIPVGSLPAGLTLNGSTGVISGDPSAAGTSSFTVQAQDSSNPAQTASATLSITIAPAKLTIATKSLPSGVAGDTYNASVTVTGGTQPYTFSIIGSLPSGLDNASGQIVGSPSAAGTSVFTVQVQDSGSPAQTASANLSITIDGALAITTASLPGVVVGIPYNVRVAATGGVPPLTFSATGLPNGLSMNSSGLITGISSTVGTFPFVEVSVTDSSSPTFPNTAFADLSITTYNKLALPATKLEPGYTGDDYDTANPSALIPVTGGVPPYTFSIASGSLPAGLTLNSGGGIVGTPSSPGTSNFTVQVTDSAIPQEKASENLSLKVVVTMVVTAGTLHNGTIGVPYSGELGVVGGTPPYNCSLPSGIVFGGSGGTVVIGGGGPAPTNSLPPGLVLLPDGTVEGTPTGPAGTYNAVIEVHDSGNPIQTVDFAITWTVQ